jgi:uncharacterized membrane protein YcaP (DUF421 family)
MELVLRGVVVYLVLLLLLRAAGNRQFAQMTSFDLVLLLIIAEVAQQALVGEDFSLTGAAVLVVVLVGLDVLLSHLKHRWPSADAALEGLPILLVDRGELLRGPMDRERVDPEDILAAARAAHGLERLDQVRFAVLERDGTISIVPRRD